MMEMTTLDGLATAQWAGLHFTRPPVQEEVPQAPMYPRRPMLTSLAARTAAAGVATTISGFIPNLPAFVAQSTALKTAVAMEATVAQNAVDERAMMMVAAAVALAASTASGGSVRQREF
uniref:Uncharacterized protein n=1 Tax=Haptolina brevifila TaxID=156173 RepID=A0A7S2HD70_9EUKA|eukprot:CAMPEP_0174718604 /NCGR_PEP_ID=MMETSP1094-20130205/29466_1 /TAXON_ID=156173 /ORGANISM="Chrysochromulina brevifilum, Strain UTEX LB 985" /LENGTH=118 /DNA_ID=CAMNT_0015918747 /DNA_START=48 /DNA_END=404 /DNA_ORIENTATION=-